MHHWHLIWWPSLMLRISDRPKFLSISNTMEFEFRLRTFEKVQIISFKVDCVCVYTFLKSCNYSKALHDFLLLSFPFKIFAFFFFFLSIQLTWPINSLSKVTILSFIIHKKESLMFAPHSQSLTRWLWKPYFIINLKKNNWNIILYN